MASYHFNSDDMSVDSEIPIMSSLILNLPAQSLKSACYGRICICEFIGIIMQLCFLKQNYVQLLHKNIIQGLTNQRNVYSSQIGEPYPCSQVTFVEISWRSDWLLTHKLRVHIMQRRLYRSLKACDGPSRARMQLLLVLVSV